MSLPTQTDAVYLSQDSLWSTKAFQLDVCNESMRTGTPLAFVTLLQKKNNPLLTYFTKKVALWCWASFLPHPFPLDSDAWETRTTSPYPLGWMKRHFPAMPACTSSSQDGVLFSTTNLPLFVPKTSSTLPSGRGNKSVAREIAPCRQCVIQKLWSCDNCPLVFMQ